MPVNFICDMATISSSRHVSPIKHKVDEWVRLLDLFSRTLDESQKYQRNSIYLEQIFNAPDIQRQLPSDAKMFGQVDKSWGEVMRRTNNSSIPTSCNEARLTRPVLLNNELLNQIMEGLKDYLESLLVIFPMMSEWS